MADPRYGSYRDLAKDYETRLDTLIEQGIFKPVFLYHVVILNIIPLIGLVIPRSKGGQYVRKGLFVLCIAIAIEIFQNRRAIIGGNGYMLGLMTAWWLVWNATLFVFTDLEHDFKRIERKPVDIKSNDAKTLCSNNPTCTQQDSNLFIWRSYPKKFWHRLEWSAGLLFNLRGPEWNWRTSHLGPLPRPIHDQLHPGFVGKIKAHEPSTYPNGKHRLQAAFRKFLISYLVLDILKVIVLMPDPYFQGLAPADSLSPFPFFYFTNFTLHPAISQICRRLYSAISVYTALEFVTSLNPIFFLGLSLAFPNGARKLTAAPLGASWLYSDAFGPFFVPVLDDGLAGCWGRWWHQIFRYGFVASARWILSVLPVGLASHPQVRRVTYVMVAFCLSGFVHACGSRTQIADTSPVSGPFLFFALQGVAIMAEQVFKTSVFPKSPFARAPRWLRRTTNFVFVFCWLMASGGLIADDFARGGLWLMEPLPISPLRGLGFGLQGQGWWCWDEPWFRYWSDGTYWGSGIRAL
ncbi:hypothetical protein DTO013E5_5189 [Penicillium roqueforti]|uniref:Wax synthase domain-containing protein n=1 Tax=Penicillium roqueforti (strain FM164) TaxID=1365484 RepID=W6QIQ6_PENRF|nr:hypothetical protein CBS147337_3314 [Penicillium roqueforti]CDM29477.1 hypothetical protein PROQFM164_S01g003289 [Penicillium roqueforti FM164]KAI2725144.1 hypothetical protein CBS147354_5097 [Penicillium roqueforti]KAI2741768.1 hypothetical protein DTO012A1_4330 [Penicillium roqueforti]KAI2750312.1 hypothetical protein DTO013F2_4775 [Penicillium roqueforti]